MASSRSFILQIPSILSSEAARAFIPTRHNAISQLQEVITAIGIEEASAVTSIPSWKFHDWLGGGRTAIYPVERKTIWIIWCIVLHPERLRSLFDIATFGRYLPADLKPVKHHKPKKRPQRVAYGPVDRFRLIQALAQVA